MRLLGYIKRNYIIKDCGIYQHFCFYSKLSEESLVNQYGYLEWLIPALNLREAIWKLFLGEKEPH